MIRLRDGTTRVLVSCLAYLVLSSGQAGADQEPRPASPDLVFRLALQPNEANKAWDASYLVKRDLEARSDGRIKVLFYPAGVLGNERQLLESCYLGIVEMVQCTSSVVTTLDPTFDVLDMPYLFADEAHHQRILNGQIGQELLDALSRHRLRGLAFYSCGFRNIYASKPVREPADLAAMKIRVMESPVMISALNCMGASSTPLSASEVFTALKTGVVDGAENNPNVYVSTAHIEAVKYYSLTRHFANQHVLVANKPWLDKVAREFPDLYDLIRSVPKDVIAEYNRRWEAAEAKAFAEIQAQGGTIVDVTRANILKFMERVEPVYESKKKNVPPELVQRIRQEMAP